MPIPPVVLACASACCFGVALVTGRVGLRSLDARAGATVSVPTATLLLLAAAPFAFDPTGFDARAAWLFAAVGLVFPAVVTLLTFRANELLGPTVTGAVSGTAPLFALAAAALVLGERVPAHAPLAAAGVVAGIALLSWRPGAGRGGFVGGALWWPVAGAMLRGFAQAAAKAGLQLWASPFAASLVGYVMSSVVVLGADRSRRAPRRPYGRAGVAWFAATGVLNGAGVLLMYAALAVGPVWIVAPVVAAYPLVTALVGAALLRDERLTLNVAIGTVATVAAVAFLVGARPGG